MINTNQKFNVKIYDDYNARLAWFKCSGTKDAIIKKICDEWSQITEDEVIGILEGALNCGRIYMSDFVDHAHLGYTDYWVDVSNKK